MSLVEAACAKFNNEQELVESSLSDLFHQYPENTELRHILLKVIAVNALYRTSIYAVEEVALEIQRNVPCLDQALRQGQVEVVEKLALVNLGGKTRNLYSFASKFCSWHQPTLFPIYDSRVERYLWTLQKQQPFTQVLHRHEDLWSYPNFYKIIQDFRVEFGLDQFSFKEIDKFLYSYDGFDPTSDLEGENGVGLV